MISFSELLPRLRDATKTDAQNWTWTHPACGGQVRIHTVGSRWDATCEKCGKLGEQDFQGRLAGGTADFESADDGSSPSPEANSEAQPAQEEVMRNGSPEVQRGLDVKVPAAGVNEAGGGHTRRAVPENPTLHANGNGKPPPRTRASVPARYAPADDILKRKPPQNLEAEQAVFASILIDNETLNVARKNIGVDSFYREAHRELFRAMVALHERGVPIEALTLGQELRTRGVYEAIGGRDYLLEVAAAESTARHMEHYAGIVRDMALKRHIASQATMLASLAYDGVTADALVGEMERLLKPIAESNGPELPSLITRDIEVWSARDFHARNSVAKARQWLVDGFLAKKEISLWSGKVEAGKTTLLRTLCMCVMRGEFFLERHTYPSRILYVMLDADGEDLTYEEFNKLGLNWQEDPIDFLVDPVMAIRPRSFEQFHGKLLELKPDMVIIDPLGRFEKTEMGAILDYSMTYVMARFSELAKQTNCHIVLLHHIPRGRNDADDPATAGFGSIAIAGGCNARFSCIKKAGGIYTIRSSQGKGGGFTPFPSEMVLDRDELTHWVTVRGPYDWKEQARVIEPAVLEAIQASEEWLAANDLGKIVGVQRSIAGAAAKSLARDGRIRMTVTKANKHLFARNQPQGELEDLK